eukprot:6872417-Pyramimonas_sp.AAC.2
MRPPRLATPPSGEQSAPMWLSRTGDRRFSSGFPRTRLWTRLLRSTWTPRTGWGMAGRTCLLALP